MRELVRYADCGKKICRELARIYRMIKCIVCSAKFPPRRKNHVCCSPKCRSVVTNTRKRTNSSHKKCRTCTRDLPVAAYVLTHPSCKECEQLRAANLKRCNSCEQIKDRSQFHKRASKDGCEANCKACSAEEARTLNASPEKRARNRELKYRRRYGIGVVEVQQMYQKQSGRCAICKSEMTNEATAEPSRPMFHVDHNHRTGRVRALLCMKCNALIGQCSEDPDVLRAAINYLEEHSDGTYMGS